jgi:hypothetical protein
MGRETRAIGAAVPSIETSGALAPAGQWMIENSPASIPLEAQTLQAVVSATSSSAAASSSDGGPLSSYDVRQGVWASHEVRSV